MPDPDIEWSWININNNFSINFDSCSWGKLGFPTVVGIGNILVAFKIFCCKRTQMIINVFIFIISTILSIVSLCTFSRKLRIDREDANEGDEARTMKYNEVDSWVKWHTQIFLLHILSFCLYPISILICWAN